MIPIMSKIIMDFRIPLMKSMICLLKSAPIKAPKGINAVTKAALSSDVSESHELIFEMTS